jgi:hypothetical protein
MSRNAITRKISLVISPLVLLALFSCQSTSTLYQGKSVDAKFVTPLPGNVTQEKWATDDLIIDYGYSEDGLVFTMQGKINLTDQYAEIYHYLDRLNVYLLFLNSNLNVIRTEDLASSVSGSPQDSIPFNKSFDIPQNATSFSFAYYGTVREMDRKGGNTATLWFTPK